MYASSLLPVLLFLASANAIAIDRNQAMVARNAAVSETKVVNGVTLSKRDNCWFDPFGVIFTCSGGSASSSSSSSSSSASKSTSTSASKSSTSSSSSSTSSSSSSSTSSSSSSSSSASKSSSTASSSSSSSSSAAATTSAAAVVNPVASVVNPVVSVATSVVSPVVSVAASVVNPVVSSASSVVNPVVSAAASVVNPVASSASSVVSPVVSAAASVVNPVVSSASSVVSPVVSVAASVVNPVVSSASSVVNPVVSVVSSANPVVNTIISSVSSAILGGASSVSSAVVTVVPTTTSTSTASSSTSSAAPTPTNAAVSGWRFASGIQEGTGGRALTAAATAGQTMTVESCLAYCDSLNFPLAGLEYGAECYCGTVLSNGASLTKTATATMPCAGNAGELCGGPSVLSLYVSTKSNAAGLSSDLSSQAVSLPAGWASSNCIQEVSGRALVEKSTASDDMTIGKCLSFCGNYKYAGLEYGRECYCGNTLQNGASFTSTSGQCVTPCAGMSTNTCGGPNALQMYTNANYKAPSTGAYVSGGCVQEVSGRALRGASTAGASMTIETCTSFCSSQGFKIAGLEYGQECYCDNAWQGGASASNYSGQCNMPCAGNSAQNCGGPNAINFYTLGGV